MIRIRHSRSSKPILAAVSVALAAVAVTGCTSSSGSTANESANQLVLNGLAAEKAGNVNQAFTDYMAAAAKDPHNKYAHYDLGYVYQQQGKVSNASSEYRKTLLIDPTFAAAVYNLGVLETPVDPATAISYFQQDLALEPNNASSNFDLGLLLIKQGETTEGYKFLETGLKLNPSLSTAVPPGVTVPSTTSTTIR